MYLGYFFNLSSSYVGFHKLVRKLAKLAEYLSLVTGRPFGRHCCRAGRWGAAGNPSPPGGKSQASRLDGLDVPELTLQEVRNSAPGAPFGTGRSSPAVWAVWGGPPPRAHGLRKEPSQSHCTAGHAHGYKPPLGYWVGFVSSQVSGPRLQLQSSFWSVNDHRPQHGSGLSVPLMSVRVDVGA